MANQQPSNIEPYIQPGNPITKEPLESKVAENRANNHSSTQDNAIVPSERSQEGTFSSLGRGVEGGSGPVDATEARSTGSGAGEQPQNPNVDAEQLATLSEGKVADAVQRKSGTQKAPGDAEVKYDDYASDLDRKKAEQAAARDEIKEAREAGIDVDGGSAGGNVRGAVQVD